MRSHMKLPNSKLLVAVLIGFVIGFLLTMYLHPETEIVSKTETIVDTIYVPKKIPVRYDSIVYVPKPYKVKDTIKIGADGLPTITRYYKDSVSLAPGLIVNYDAEVDGHLNKLQLGLTDKRPDKVIRTTTTTTNTILDNKPHLYLGGEIDLKMNSPALGAIFQNKKNVLQYRYEFNSVSPHNIGYYRRIF